MKQFSLTKKLSIVIAMLVMLLSITPMASMAQSSSYTKFSFDILADGELVRGTAFRLRDTNKVSDAWAVNMSYSDEHTSAHPDGSGKTKTLFWLGIYNPNGTNPAGSKKVLVLEDGGTYYNKAYDSANGKKVAMYGKDNSSTNKRYGVEGKWSPNVDRSPSN